MLEKTLLQMNMKCHVFSSYQVCVSNRTQYELPIVLLRMNIKCYVFSNHVDGKGNNRDKSETRDNGQDRGGTGRVVSPTGEM